MELLQNITTFSLLRIMYTWLQTVELGLHLYYNRTT